MIVYYFNGFNLTSLINFIHLYSFSISSMVKPVHTASDSSQETVHMPQRGFRLLKTDLFSSSITLLPRS